MLGACGAAIALLCFVPMIVGGWALAMLMAWHAGHFVAGLLASAFVATFFVAGWRAETRHRRERGF